MSYPGQWYAYVSGQVQGPYTADAIQTMVRSGAITAETQLCGDGKTYVPASQAFPQLFGGPAAAAGPRAPALPPMPGARPAGGSNTAVWLVLGLAGGAVLILILLILLLSGRGGAASGLLAELPAGAWVEVVDLDGATEMEDRREPELSEATGLPHSLNQKLLDMFPKGRRGVMAVVRGDGFTASFAVYQPRALDDSAFSRLLEENGYEKDKESSLRLWRPKGVQERCVALHRGRIYSGSTELVKDMVSGKLAPEKTLANQKGCRELIRELASSAPVIFLTTRHETLFFERPKTAGATASAAEVTLRGERITMRCLWQYERSEDAARALEELKGAEKELEDRAGRERLPILRSGWKFERITFARSGNTVTLSATYRKSGK